MNVALPMYAVLGHWSLLPFSLSTVLAIGGLGIDAVAAARSPLHAGCSVKGASGYLDFTSKFNRLQEYTGVY